MKTFPKKLISGYHNFIINRFPSEKKRHEALAIEGQKPKIMVIACCDSRAAPETIFDSNPGEIFVLRNIGNLVPKFMPDNGYHSTSAAIEYAVQALNIEHLVILGHACCGAIETIINTNSKPLSCGDFVGKWTEALKPLAEKIITPNISQQEKQKKLEHASIIQSLKNLRSFPFMQKAEKENKVKLHGAWFGIADGQLLILDEGTNNFYPIAKDKHVC